MPTILALSSTVAVGHDDEIGDCIQRVGKYIDAPGKIAVVVAEKDLHVPIGVEPDRVGSGFLR